MNDSSPKGSTSTEAIETDGAGQGEPPAAAAPDGAPDPLMLELLVCPLTKKSLDYDAEANELISSHAGLAYPVRGGVPILLPSEARSLAEDAPGVDP